MTWPFRAPDADGGTPKSPELARATDVEKQSQLDRLADFHARHREQAPTALARLQETATNGGNVFGALTDAVRVCSLGQMGDAFSRSAASTAARLRSPVAPASDSAVPSGTAPGRPADAGRSRAVFRHERTRRCSRHWRFGPT